LVDFLEWSTDLICFFSSLFVDGGLNMLDQTTISTIATQYAGNSKNTLRNVLANITNILSLQYRAGFCKKLFWLWSHTELIDLPSVIVEILPPKTLFKNMETNNSNKGNSNHDSNKVNLT
jgi:hypothetical protein